MGYTDYFLIVWDFVAFSRRFIIEKMNNAATTQITINTPHTIARSIPHRKPGIATSMLPNAVDTNHAPIIIPLYFGGATLYERDTNGAQ